MLKNLFIKVLKDERYYLDYYYNLDNDIKTVNTAEIKNIYVENEFRKFKSNNEIIYIVKEKEINDKEKVKKIKMKKKRI